MNIATHDAFQDGYRALLARAAEQENARLAEVIGCNRMVAEQRIACAAVVATPPEVFIAAVAQLAGAGGGATINDVCDIIPFLDRKTVSRRLRALWRADALHREHERGVVFYSLPRAHEPQK